MVTINSQVLQCVPTEYKSRKLFVKYEFRVKQ